MTLWSLPKDCPICETCLRYTLTKAIQDVRKQRKLADWNATRADLVYSDSILLGVELYDGQQSYVVTPDRVLDADIGEWWFLQQAQLNGARARRLRTQRLAPPPVLPALGTFHWYILLIEGELKPIGEHEKRLVDHLARGMELWAPEGWLPDEIHIVAQRTIEVQRMVMVRTFDRSTPEVSIGFSTQGSVLIEHNDQERELLNNLLTDFSSSLYVMTLKREG